ncbi:MAG: aldo/keto reductase, partial [Acidimicrobiia bacterium]
MRPFGATGLQISAVSFGAGAVGGAVIGGEPEDRVAIMRYAMDRGINWVDTAPYYGSGKSEEHLGQIFRALGDRPYISTKVRLWPGDFEDIGAAIERTARESLARLGLERVELLQLHNRVHVVRDLDREAISVDDVLGPGGVADALERLRGLRLTQHIGFTGLGDAEALHALI